jgi:branched-chain amino acid transport system permease protein
MGDGILISSFIVVVIGGLGSIGGTFWAALLVGLIDTLGQVYFPQIAGMAVCGLMALVLSWRPTGLFSRV